MSRVNVTAPLGTFSAMCTCSKTTNPERPTTRNSTLFQWRSTSVGDPEEVTRQWIKTATAIILNHVYIIEAADASDYWRHLFTNVVWLMAWIKFLAMESMLMIHVCLTHTRCKHQRQHKEYTSLLCICSICWTNDPTLSDSTWSHRGPYELGQRAAGRTKEVRRATQQVDFISTNDFHDFCNARFEHGHVWFMWTNQHVIMHLTRDIYHETTFPPLQIHQFDLALE